MVGAFFWDPPREMFAFNIPFLGRPILWYGFFFALGFLLGYLLLVYLLKEYFLHSKTEFSSKKPKAIAEKALMYAILGVLLGARLVDVLFYQDWREIAHSPLMVFEVWKGGLASHGGVLGVIVAFFILAKKEKKLFSPLTFLGFLDIVCLPAALLAGFIRVGNFVNQEILGTMTCLPWGVIFGHPADGTFPTARHPVQLYEAIFYFFLAALLFAFRKKTAAKKPGAIAGLFLIVLFLFRFLVEYVKVEQSAYLGRGAFCTMGQLLSIPMILLGVFLFVRSCKKSRHSK